jgi:hypothetical protein
MRELTQSEIITVGAGASCIDAIMFKNLQDKAIRDAAAFSMITGAITFAIGYGLFASASIGGGVALVLAPYAAGLGYFSSSAWTIFS